MNKTKGQKDDKKDDRFKCIHNIQRYLKGTLNQVLCQEWFFYKFVYSHKEVHMKKLFVVFIMISFVCIYCGFFTDQAIANKSGAPPGTTGAPGEDDCTKCHAGSVNSGSGDIVVDFNSGGTSYEINNTYTIDVVIGGSAATNGFSFVALDENGSNAGSINLTNATNTMTTSLNGKNYVSHKDANTQITDSWQFEWVAPSLGVGPVTFYVAGNASNGGNNN